MRYILSSIVLCSLILTSCGQDIPPQNISNVSGSINQSSGSLTSEHIDSAIHPQSTTGSR